MQNLLTKFLILLIPILSYSSPTWYGSTHTTHLNEIVSYGESEDLNIAKQIAIKDISTTLQVNIKSSTNINKSSVNNNYNKSINENIQTKSIATLNGIKFLKQEKIDNIWYVKASYDNSTLNLKVKRNLPKHLKNEKQNDYLKNTTLFTTLNDDIKFKLDYKILRKDNLWQLQYKDMLLVLNQKDFYKLFTNISNRNISIQANKKTYKNGDDLFFDIDIENEGFVSILYVQYNGKVGVLLDNYKASKSFVYPDHKIEDYFIINNDLNKSIYEQCIAIYSKEAIDLKRFQYLEDEQLDELTFQFDSLIKQLHEKQFSTFVLKIN